MRSTALQFQRGKMTEKTAPQSQQLRSARTRRKILQATLDSIYEDGFQNASTPEIVRRAGVSRGALLHHFPSKEQLIAAAVQFLLDAEVADMRRVASAYAERRLTMDDFIDDMWRRFSGRLFMITIDFLASARTDDKLREAVIPVSLQFHRSLNEIWSQFFVNHSLAPRKVQTLLNATLCMMRGMGVQSIIRNDPQYYSEIQETWKEILRMLLSEEAPEQRNTA